MNQFNSNRFDRTDFHMVALHGNKCVVYIFILT